MAPYKHDFLYKRVVFIGIDGVGNAVKDPQANATNIQKLMKEGAGTYEAKAMMPTISAENWGAILHGVVPSKHKLTNAIVAATPYPENNPYPSYLKLLKQERPMSQQASFASGPTFSFISMKWTELATTMAISPRLFIKHCKKKISM
ncbi:alkaline phosphatase family protein [Brevibacillus sp. NRS-1366]|uniref:alkaline phosphatase family protein n=1 Tax=Brevibacillus sp. NRS-1366 TaxID=3233899 RepID=UPI003D2601A2